MKDKIAAALRKLGPSSPTVIANEVKAEPSAVGYHLRGMLKAKALIAAGTSIDRVYGLPDQDLGRAPTPPPAREEDAQGRAASERARAAGNKAEGDAERRFHARDHRRQPSGAGRGRQAGADLRRRADRGDRHAAARQL